MAAQGFMSTSQFVSRSYQFPIMGEWRAGRRAGREERVGYLWLQAIGLEAGVAAVHGKLESSGKSTASF